MNKRGRMAACGMISRYNDKDGTPQPGPHNRFLVVGKRIRMQGFIVSDHAARRGDFQRDVGQWIRDGRVKWKEPVYEGLDRAAEAFLGLFRGDNFGKMVVRVSPPRLGCGATADPCSAHTPIPPPQRPSPTRNPRP